MDNYSVCRKADGAPMLKINNRKLEDQVKQILQHTACASAEEYLMAWVARDSQAVKMGKKLP